MADAFIKARQDAFLGQLLSRDVGGMVAFMSDKVLYNDISFGILNVNKAAISDVFAKYHEWGDITKASKNEVTGTDHFVAWEWVFECVSKKDDLALNLKSKENGTLKGVSLVWWEKEDGIGGFQGWKVVKWVDYTSANFAMEQ